MQKPRQSWLWKSVANGRNWNSRTGLSGDDKAKNSIRIKPKLGSDSLNAAGCGGTRDVVVIFKRPKN